MGQNEDVLALVPARGGSKGVPRKNLRPLGGKPLIAWTIEAALATRGVTRIVVSTDDNDIAETAKAFGAEVPFLRPVELATDQAGMLGVVRHALTNLSGSFGFLVLLQPTSPLRAASDIDAAVRLCKESGAPSCVGVTALSKSPQWMFRLDPQRRLRPLVKAAPSDARRQDLPVAHALNGAIYVARCDWIMEAESFIGPETVAYEMPRERSVDIDTEFDFMIAEALIAVGSPTAKGAAK